MICFLILDLGASAVVMYSMNQPVFLTVRVGDLSIERPDKSFDRNSLGSDCSCDVHIRLRKTPTANPLAHADPVWNQRYTVEPLENEDENKRMTKWSDLGELVLAPGEQPPRTKHSNQYKPGTRLCPPQSFLLRPKLGEQVYLTGIMQYNLK